MHWDFYSVRSSGFEGQLAMADRDPSLRILMVVPRLETGGMETTVLEQARYLRAQGLDVHLLALMSGGSLCERADTWGIPLTMATETLTLRPAAAFIDRTAKALDIHIVHSHTGTWLPAALGARRRAIPHVHTRHGFVTTRGTLMSEFMGARMTRHVICVSGELLQHSRRVLRVPPHRSEYLGNGIDLSNLPDRSAPTDTQTALVMICRLAPVKNIALALDALRQARERSPSISLTIIGDGPEREALMRRSTDLGIADAVTFRGQLDHPWIDVPGGAIFIQSSDSEGLSLSLIEAMAAGCRVVATDVGQTRAFTTGASGVMLIPPRHASGLAEAIVAMVSMAPEHARQAEASNRSHASVAGNLAHKVTRLREIYREVLDV
jgi:glycosyltransferase involved in cell wall biosynthesis